MICGRHKTIARLVLSVGSFFDFVLHKIPPTIWNLFIRSGIFGDPIGVQILEMMFWHSGFPCWAFRISSRLISKNGCRYLGWISSLSTLSLTVSSLDQDECHGKNAPSFVDGISLKIWATSSWACASSAWVWTTSGSNPSFSHDLQVSTSLLHMLLWSAFGSSIHFGFVSINFTMSSWS